MASCTPDSAAPLNYSSCLENIMGVDKNGDVAHLRKGQGVLFGPDGSVCSRWADGSEARPIILPSMMERQSARSVVALLADGKMVQLVPSGIDGKGVLMYEAGAVFFTPENLHKTVFASDSLEEYTGCDYKLAVFESCDGDGASRLRWADFGDALCSGAAEAASALTILGCRDGKHVALKPSNGAESTLRFKDGNWVVEQVETTTGVGLLTYPKSIGIYVGAGALGSVNWDSLVPPADRGGGVYAEISIWATLTGVGVCQAAIQWGSEYIQVLSAQAGNPEQERFNFRHAVTPGGSATFGFLHIAGPAPVAWNSLFTVTAFLA